MSFQIYTRFDKSQVIVEIYVQINFSSPTSSESGLYFTVKQLNNQLIIKHLVTKKNS